MPIGNKPPRGLLLLGFRLPIWLYRLHLDLVLGERFLLLTHIGRKSGLPHQTVIEVVRHDKLTDTYFVVSGFGRRADWFLNIKQNPDVMITIKGREILMRARQLSDSDGAQVLFGYAKRHPLAFGEISFLLVGKRLLPSEENCLRFVQSMPVIAFEPRSIYPMNVLSHHEQ